jgi:hypothetical protein
MAYRKYIGKNPYPHAVKDEILQHLIALGETGNRNHLQFETKTDIIFDQVSFGRSFKSLSSERGVPDGYSIQQYNPWMMVAARYSVGTGNQRFRKVFFFLNDRLVGGEFVYTGNEPNQSQMIKQQLIEKYNVVLQNEETYKFSIIDRNNNKLIYDATGFNLTLRYGSNNDHELQQILNTLFQSANNNEVVDQKSDFSAL